MVNQQLTDYIKLQLQQGISKEQIVNSLLANSWNSQDIEDGFKSIDNPAIISNKFNSMPSVAKSHFARNFFVSSSSGTLLTTCI